MFENKGGAGRYHSLALLGGPDSDGATGEWLREGGDEYWVEVLGRVAFGNRCKAGLAAVSIAGPTTALVSLNITPFAFLVLGDQGAMPAPTTTSLTRGAATIEAGKDLIDHAEACIGTAEFLYAQIHAAEVNTAEIGIAENRRNQVCAFQICARQHRAAEIGGAEVRTGKVGIEQERPTQVCLA